MEGLSRALRLLIKLLSIALGSLIALGTLLIGLLMWSGANTERSSYECVVRRMDHHIGADDTGAYHDTCMASLGYRRAGSCYSGNLIAAPAFCFAPGWQFWR